MRLITMLCCFLSITVSAEETINTIYQLTVETDSNMTSIEIRDDAEFIIPPDNAPMQMYSSKGARSYTISQKKITFEQISRGESVFDIYVKSNNMVLGLTVCKGLRTSYALVKSAEGKHKNDVDEPDYCEKAALVLLLH